MPERMTEEIPLNIWPVGTIILAVLFVTVLVTFWRRRHSFTQLLCLVVFSIYLFMALDRLFFPIFINGSYAEAMKQAPLSENLNLIPFYFGRFGTLESSLETLALNVLLTIPFGFGINFLVHIKARRILWIALAVGLFTEGGQLLISLLIGYFYHIVDVNDVLMNALGVLVGYVLFRIFAWLYVWIIGRFSFKHWGFIGYLYDVASRA
jgi:glycopeptide antibiotics resistance protein